MRLLDKIKYKYLEDKDLFTNMALSSICKPLSLILSYLYIPIVMDYLGMEKYGVWTIILSILSWISYFDIGIGNGLRNKLTESLARNNGESRKLVSSAYAIIATIMIVVAIAFSVGASFADWNRIFGVESANENLTLIVIISIIFVVIDFILSICKSVLFALQKAANVSFMELGVQILNISGVLIAKRFIENNLFMMSVIYGSSLIIVNTIVSIVLYLKNKEVRPSVHYIDIQTGKSLTNLGVQFFVIQIAALVLFTTDSLIISYLYGAENVVPYSTVNKLFSVIIRVYAAMLAPLWSAVTKAKVENGYQQLKRLMRKLNVIMAVFGIGTILLVIIFRPVTRIWLHRDLNYSTMLIVLGGIYCLLSNWCNTYANIANGLELMKMSMITAVVQATVNIPLSLLFAVTFNMKDAGVLAGTVISMLISAIVQPLAVHVTINKHLK